jgi:hypothetical protein
MGHTLFWCVIFLDDALRIKQVHVACAYCGGELEFLH